MRKGKTADVEEGKKGKKILNFYKKPLAFYRPIIYNNFCVVQTV